MMMVVVGGDDDEEYSTASIGLLRKGRLPAHKPSVFFSGDECRPTIFI